MAWLLALLPSWAAAEDPAPFSLPEAPISTPVFYSADHFEYEGSTAGAGALILLRGDVEIRESTWSLKAGEALVDMATRRASASGGMVLDNGLDRLRAESGVFDLGTHAGKVELVQAQYAPWTLWADYGSVTEDQKAVFKHAMFTSCPLRPPDYYFRASTVRVRPRKWLTATNVRFYVHKVPLFYSPFLWKNLSPTHLIRTRFSEGYDRRNGGIVRTTTEFTPARPLYGKLFLDYYTAQGFAEGVETGFRADEDKRGALYGYHVRETRSGEDRWSFLGDYYQTLRSSYSAQARLQAQSDPDVNNNYARSNAFRVTTQLDNSGAFVRQTARTTTRLSYSRQDVADGVGGYRKTRESAPRLDFQTAPTGWRRVPLLFTYTGFADNSLVDANRGFIQRSLGGGVEATQTKVLAPGVSLTPRATYREIFEDRRDDWTDAGSSQTLRTFRNVFTGFYGAGTNLRFDTRAGVWDAAYFYEGRFKPNSMQRDAGSRDYGTQSSLLTLQDTIRPSRRILLRGGTGYDFRRFRDVDAGMRARVQPFTADIVLTPRRWLDVTVRDSYQLGRGNREFLVQTDLGDRTGDFAGVGVAHTLDRPELYVGSMDFAWAPERFRWKFGGALRSQVSTPGGFDLRAFQVFEKELVISRQLHDFDTRLLVRFRPGNVKEILFRINLRAERVVTERRKVQKETDKEWFPWRGRGEADQER